MLKNQIKATRIKTLNFENAIHRAVHERSNNAASFAEHLEFQEKLTFSDTLSVKSGKLK